jgi:hypothetical protein
LNKVNRVIGAEVDTLQRDTFGYFQPEVNSVNGLVIDNTAQNSPSSIAATGYQGLYYHFLDMQTGRRAGQCELSTVDSAFPLAGMLTSAAYFDAGTDDEQEIRTVADALYRRANWLCGGRVSMEAGFRISSMRALSHGACIVEGLT